MFGAKHDIKYLDNMFKNKRKFQNNWVKLLKIKKIMKI